MNRAEWYYYKYVLAGYRLLYKKIYKKKLIPSRFGGMAILSEVDGNKIIATLINNDKPFMVGRYGSNEIRVISDTIATHLNIYKNIRQGSIDALINGAGFFPNNRELALDFGELMLDASSQLDLVGVFINTMEDYVIKNFSPHAKLTILRGLEPWYSHNPWTKELKGKKVLVIHPFDETIQMQYKVREKLFDHQNILPEFELITIKAIQTIAGQIDSRFENWFDALNFMYEEAMKRDFEIAIIGCGAYGFPLAAMLKKAGKKAIHLGGATQIMFGIKGNRWDNHPVISKLYNENWVRPLESDRPKNAEKVEGACYW